MKLLVNVLVALDIGGGQIIITTNTNTNTTTDTTDTNTGVADNGTFGAFGGGL